MSEVIRISDDQRDWLDKKKLEYFNTEDVSYRAVIEKIKQNV
jgi:hypothetical protein